MSECIFCKIINKTAPGVILYHDELVTAFKDIRPVAPVHILIVPNEHITSVEELTEANASIIGHMIITARNLAKQYNVSKTGYRLIVNTGPDSGQAVFHLHLHLIAGHRMRFPMG